MPCVAPCSGRTFELSANYEVDVYATDKVTLIGKAFSDVKGNYLIELPTGNYTIFTGLIGNEQANQVSVFAGKDTIFNIVWGDSS